METPMMSWEFEHDFESAVAARAGTAVLMFDYYGAT
jgi:hypothetical protein